jgi:uncharacterized RDD family membrane protein YckC
VPPPGWGASGLPPSHTRDLRHENRRGLDSRRLVARTVDWLLLSPLGFAAVWEWGTNLGTLALFQCLLLIYHHVFEVTTGATPGKRLLGLRVARIDDGELPRPRQAAVRGVIGIFEFGLIACIAIMVTKQRRRLGDYAAGTAVVSARKHPVLPRPLFRGAVAYPVVWAVPALVAIVLGARGDLPGTYREQADAICASAGTELRRMLPIYGVMAIPAVYQERDYRIASLRVPNAWRDRHERLLATLRSQTLWVSTGIATARDAPEPRAVLRRFSVKLAAKGRRDGATVAALGFHACSGESV